MENLIARSLERAVIGEEQHDVEPVQREMWVLR